MSVRDPRGTVTQLARAFTSLGPDTMPPIVVIDSPLGGTLVGAETDVTVTLHADDGDGALVSLRWSATWSGRADGRRAACPLAAGASYQALHVLVSDRDAPDHAGGAASSTPRPLDSAGNTGTRRGRRCGWRGGRR